MGLKIITIRIIFFRSVHGLPGRLYWPHSMKIIFLGSLKFFRFTVLYQERSSFRSDRRLSGTFRDGELQYPVTESITFYWCKGFLHFTHVTSFFWCKCKLYRANKKSGTSCIQCKILLFGFWDYNIFYG